MVAATKLPYIGLHPTTEPLCITELDAGGKLAKLTQLLKENLLAYVLDSTGSKKKLFLSSQTDQLCEARSMTARRGSVADKYDLEDYQTAVINKPLTPEEKQENVMRRRANLVRKLKNEASKAKFTNSFIRDCLNADETKTLVENNIGGGSDNEGTFKTVVVIAKHLNGQHRTDFLQAIEKKQEFKYQGRICGYDGKIELGINKDNEFYGTISLEYTGRGHGHYYLLISEKNFTYYEKD
jgi:hypothetical protein